MQQENVVLRFDKREDFKGTLRTFMVPADQVGFERTYGVGIGKAEEEERAEWSLWFVWRAWSRENAPEVDFEAFLADLTEYEVPPDADANPTPETPTG